MSRSTRSLRFGACTADFDVTADLMNVPPGNSRQPVQPLVLVAQANLRALGERYGHYCALAVAIAVRLHGIVSHHLSVFHYRTGGVADGTRGAASHYRAARVPPRLRVLAEDLRNRVRHGRGLRNRAGLRVRHELERTVAPFGTD